ncbi:MAG TPA: RibD family protein [Candidatus Limnocylindrales bacterium]|nr:RibD family protein [Candidatus Limnocylindrales bacterium]
MSAADLIDRLWPDPAAGLMLRDAFADLQPPSPRDGRPGVALNMVTSIDGRAQLAGRAEGIGSRTDRRLMQIYRTAFDAVGCGGGTLRADDFYSHLAADHAERRRLAGREPQPLAVLIAGRRELPLDRRWFGYEDQRRVLVVGSGSPHAISQPPAGVETWVAPDETPRPGWALERLAAAGVSSLMLEGGPTLNAAFLAAGAVDELFWTIGPRVLANEAKAMVAPPAGEGPAVPVEAQLVSVHRQEDELFLRYRFGNIGP